MSELAVVVWVVGAMFSVGQLVPYLYERLEGEPLYEWVGTFFTGLVFMLVVWPLFLGWVYSESGRTGDE